VAQGAVQTVLVLAPDRLSRRYAHQVLLLEEFARHGATVEFVKAPPGSGAEHELLLQVQGMIAEYEKAQILERTRRGKLHRALTGAINVLVRAPYGYRYVRRTEVEAARFEIVDHQAAVVRDIFAWYVEDGLSIGRIADRLTAAGVATYTGRSLWSHTSVSYILRNPAYTGEAVFRKTEVLEAPAQINRTQRLRGRRTSYRKARRYRPPEDWIRIRVPAIVSQERFVLAQEQAAMNQRFATRRTRRPSLLQGLVVCRQCGYAWYRSTVHGGASRDRVYRYYRCQGADGWRREHGRVCSNRPVREEVLDALVWEQVSRLLANPELVRQEVDRRARARAEAQSTSTAERERLLGELQHVRTARLRLVEAYQEGFLDRAPAADSVAPPA
jgi:site-specific DNA recombinase